MQYLMLTLVALLLAGFFAINKLYQKKFGTSLEKSMLFVCLSGAFMTVEFFIKTGFNVRYTPFSLIASASANLCEVIYTVIGFRLLKEGTMSAYTVFLMSGGMLLPFVFGIYFLNEKAELLKIIGLVFILAGVVLSGTNGNKKEKIKFRHILLCCTVFIVNGFVSIISKVHQTQTVYAVSDTDSYIVFGSFFKFVLGGVIYLFIRLRNKFKKTVIGEKTTDALPETSCDNKTKKPVVLTMILIVLASTVAGGLSGMLMLIGAKSLPASVLYPFSTSGTIIFSSIFGAVFYKEKITPKTVASVVACLIGTLLFL